MQLNKKESLLKARLEKEAAFRNNANAVSEEKLDPILIAKLYNEEYTSLVCALFAYGKVESIVKFLRSLDMALLDADEALIREKLHAHYYRFQNSEDIVQFFITLSKLKKEGSLNSFFLQGYTEENCVIAGVNALIEKMQQINGYKSRGYDFLIGKISFKRKGSGALKRWHMYLRWMVRHDRIDMGLWRGVDKKDLILPLDTHTFNMGHRLGLLKRKSYDLEAAWELTQKLRSFDKDDPVKYDFALYRLGQES